MENNLNLLTSFDFLYGKSLLCGALLVAYEIKMFLGRVNIKMRSSHLLLLNASVVRPQN